MNRYQIYRIVVPQKKLKCTRAETRIVTLYNPIPILQDSSHYGCSMNGWAIIHGPYHKFQLAFNTASHFCRLANLLSKNLYIFLVHRKQFLEERTEHKYMHCYQRKPKTFKICLQWNTDSFCFCFCCFRYLLLGKFGVLQCWGHQHVHHKVP